MDREYVLSLTDDPYALDIDMQNWEAMTFAMRKKSDDACISKYGVNNTQLYYLLKEIIEDEQQQKVLGEATASDVMQYKIDQINQSKEVQDNTGEVIIDDWIGPKPSPYYGDYLNAKYNEYLALPNDMKTRSSESSLAIWGYTVPNMYDVMMNKWNTWLDTNPEDDIIHPETIAGLVSDTQEELAVGEDALMPLLRKLDIATYEGSLYENAILEELSDTIDYTENRGTNYSTDIPTTTPWFTPDEMKELGFDVDPYTYVLDKDKDEQIKFADTIRDAARNADKNELLSLGWNPEVPYTAESAKYARDRQVKWFNEHKQVEIVDLSNFNVVSEANAVTSPIIQLEPIYLILIAHEGINSKIIRKATNSDWSHSGIAFDSKLNQIYSYNASTPEGKSGLSVESLDFYLKDSKNPKLKVMCIFVEPQVKERMLNIVDVYLNNKSKTFYDWSDMFRILLKKSKDTLYSLGMICSQFVDTILKACKIDITGKPSNLVTPKDIDTISKGNNTTRVYVLYTGLVKDYNYKLVDQKVITLVNRASNLEDLLTKPLEEAKDMIFSKRDIDGLYTITDNDKANKVLSEVRYLMTPQAVLVEAKRTPIGMGKKGNVYIDLPKDPEEEYQEAHTLLTSYNENNIEGIKHQLARLYGLDIEIRKRIKKAKNKDKDYQDMVNLRARVLNDFYKYMDIVMDAEPDFDFWWYFTGSEYYDKTIKITKPTLKYTGKAIKGVANIAKAFGLPYPIKASTIGKV